jgi:hypothetical protein
MVDFARRSAADLSHAEAAYRRGVHQALAFALDSIEGKCTLDEARDLLANAERLALEYRTSGAEVAGLIDSLRDELRGEIASGAM